MNIKEIFQGWITARNPNPEELERAKKRLDICKDCPAFKNINVFMKAPPIKTDVINVPDPKKLSIVYICSDCGCPISKKVFSPKKESCPKKIWPV